MQCRSAQHLLNPMTKALCPPPSTLDRMVPPLVQPCYCQTDRCMNCIAVQCNTALNGAPHGPPLVHHCCLSDGVLLRGAQGPRTVHYSTVLCSSEFNT